MVRLLWRLPTAGEAEALACWAYPPPYDVYDAAGIDPAFFRARTPGGEGYYPAVEHPAVDGAGVDGAGVLVAFAVLGAEARVLGQRPIPGTVDVGIGVRPDLTGRGRGGAVLDQAFDLAQQLFAPTAVRAAVATFNERSLAMCRRAGFVVVRDFPGPGGRPFRELVRALDAS